MGNYEIRARASGFKQATVTGIALAVNDNRRFTLTLEVGQLSESVSVNADVVTVNTANGTTSSVINSHEMLNLPAQGRAVVPFSLLMPGAVSTAPTRATANYTSVNGVRPTHNAWLLDGGYNIDTGGNWNITLAPNMEIVDEVRAIRSNYSAEFGIGGGSQFNVITKSGSNALHGSAYEFLRNSALNARSFFQSSLPPLKINEFGFTVGGPVIIPKLYNGKNKSFFFVNADWTTQRTATNWIQKLPEVAYRSGDFSALLPKAIIDPTTGQPFPGNVIPQSRISPIAASYAKLYPATNYRDALGNNWTTTEPGNNPLHQYTVRGDHNFNEKHRISARYTANYSDNFYYPSASNGFGSFEREDIGIANNTTVNLTSTLRPNLINDFNLVRVHNRLEYFPKGITPTQLGATIPKLFPVNKDTYPLASLNLTEVPARVPNASLTNYAGLAPDTPWSNFQSIFDFKDNIPWIKGAHTLKTGFDIPYEKKFEPTNTNVFGSFTFDGKVTGDAFADFLLGRAAQYDETDTVAFNDNRRLSFEAYVDDSWKVNRRLMIDLGVRYSLLPPAYEASDKYRVFLPSAYNRAQAVTVNSAGQIPLGSGNLLNGVVNPKDYWKYSKHNFAPRFSFAYDLTGDGKTSIRGGIGMFYSREILGAFILMSGNPPFGKLVSLYNTNLADPTGGATLNYGLPTTLGSIDTNQLTPYTAQWNFNIQRALSSNWLLEIGYAGSKGVHMMRTQDLNQPLLSAAVANKSISANAVRPYPGFGVISQREQSYASKYHGLQTELTRRFAHGFLLKADYTWSKALDNTDCCSGNIYNWYPNAQNANLEWGRSSFDAEHNFIATYIYEIPFFHGRRDVAGQVLGGWQLSGVTMIQTGLPIDPVVGIDQAGIGSSARQRPQVLGNPFLGRGDRTVGRWFDPTQFGVPAIGTFATTGRNFLSAPGTNNWDMSLHKTFVVREGLNLEFRADAFNVWNHTEFSSVGTNYSVPSTFGKITGAKNPRNMMLGLRLQF